MDDRHSWSSRWLPVTLLAILFLAPTVSTSAQAVGNGLDPARFIAVIDDTVLANDAGSKREAPILDPAREAATLLQRAMLRERIDSEATRLALGLGRAGFDQQSASQSRGWIQRHPVLFGALAGAGLGAVSSIPRWNELYCATGGDEECLFHGAAGVLFGAGAGAGIGALVGHLVGK